MSDPAPPALPPSAQSALLAGNRRLAVALVRQASGLDQQSAKELVARYLARSPSVPTIRLDLRTLGWAVLAGVLATALYLVLQG